MAKAEKGGYSEERIEQMEKTRDAADITIARIRKEDSNRLIELDAGTNKKRDKQFVEATKEFWREFAVHGMEKFEKGKVVLKNNSDLDGECSLALLRLAGIDTSEVEYVSKGDFRKDKINIDTGDQSGLVVKNKGKTAFFDHHGKESKNDTCATK
ncbi:MAG: hypothetical protein NT094_04530, partial [Candidatus Staskawiczbacteria bacterium]|nr:hypothetical protein [Candidatus Staskawiczbacteria bacterium]